MAKKRTRIPLTKAEAQQMRKLRKDMSIADVAKQTKRHPSTVWHYVSKTGSYYNAFR